MVETAVVNGLLGGFVATVAMTVLMMALGDDSPPPTAIFWSKYVGNAGPDSYMMQGMVLHFLYGIAGGGVLAVLLTVAGVTGLLPAVGAGLGYGFVLFVFAAGFWMNVVLDMDAGPKEAGMFLFFHLVYGGVLGAIIGLGPA